MINLNSTSSPENTYNSGLAPKHLKTHEHENLHHSIPYSENIPKVTVAEIKANVAFFELTNMNNINLLSEKFNSVNPPSSFNDILKLQAEIYNCSLPSTSTDLNVIYEKLKDFNI